MKKICISIVFTLITYTTFAMEKPNNITLISKEGNEYKFPAEFTSDASAISEQDKNLRSFKFDISDMDLNTLNTIANKVQEIKAKNLHGKDFFHEIDRRTDIPTHLKFQQACDALGYRICQELIAQKIVDSLVRTQTTESITPFVAKYEYLRKKPKRKADVNNKFNGFSVQNYLDYPLGEPLVREKSGALFGLGLNDLDGLDRLPEANILSELALNDNKLSKINKSTFNKFPSIILLRLNNNMINEIEPDSLDVLPELTDLWLGNNKLTEIKPEWFKKLSSLQNLDLRNNQLRKIKQGDLKKLSKLTILNLEGNQIDQIESGSFNDLPELDTLWLNKNKLSEIKQGDLKGLSKLTQLHLDQNQLTKIDADALKQELPKLKWLFLRGNTNKLDQKQREALAKAFPNTQIKFEW